MGDEKEEDRMNRNLRRRYIEIIKKNEEDKSEWMEGFWRISKEKGLKVGKFKEWRKMKMGEKWIKEVRKEGNIKKMERKRKMINGEEVGILIKEDLCMEGKRKRRIEEGREILIDKFKKIGVIEKKRKFEKRIRNERWLYLRIIK